MQDPYNIFQKLKDTGHSANSLITVKDIPGFQQHKIGISKSGLPMFFIATQDKDGSALDINLNLIKVQFQKVCELYNQKGEIQKGVYSIVSLQTDTDALIRYFIHTVFYLIKQLGDTPSFVQIKIELNNLVNLFRKLNKPSKNSIQGLWTELLFIEQANAPEYLINSWHKSKTDRYDFNDGIDKIEIKSTSKAERIHRFSNNQLASVKNTLVIIGSTYTIETGNGINANDLIESIFAKISDQLYIRKVNEIVADTMGDKIDQIYEFFFDYNFAINSIMYYNVTDIPTIDCNSIPSEITNLKFDCNLTKVKGIDEKSIDSRLLQAIF
ncbi:PD-(D/E)XK motif protein [Terasakiella sp.]|uniref:PD-(D/E)XK motif protein n=1 Tax=Terasakiella sp. TaxID=2034861 RepID=UPI003AA94C9E